jgi:hypothetical protein
LQKLSRAAGNMSLQRAMIFEQNFKKTWLKGSYISCQKRGTPALFKASHLSLRAHIHISIL